MVNDEKRSAKMREHTYTLKVETARKYNADITKCFEHKVISFSSNRNE